MISEEHCSKMKRRKSRGYRFAENIMSSDTVISLVSGLLSATLIIASVVISIVNGGITGSLVTIFMGSSLVLALNGLIFGLLSFKDVSGGTNSKINVVIINSVCLVLLLVLFIV